MWEKFMCTNIIFIQTWQGWRSPGFLVSRASTLSSSSSDPSPSSSSPSLDSRSSSPLPGEPQGPLAFQTTSPDSKTVTQTDRWLMWLCVCLLTVTCRCLVSEDCCFSCLSLYMSDGMLNGLNSFLFVFSFQVTRSSAVRSIFSQRLPAKEK